MFSASAGSDRDVTMSPELQRSGRRFAASLAYCNGSAAVHRGLPAISAESWLRLRGTDLAQYGQQGAAMTTEPASVPEKERERFKSRILLAEDSQTNAMVATALLERRGARVDLVTNGREALDAVRQRPYDLIIMDIAMPEMDGLTATRQIRPLGGPFAHLPILGMTAHAMPGDEKACRDAGMDHYLTKPIDRPAFLKAVGDLLARAPAAAAPVAMPMIDLDQ